MLKNKFFSKENVMFFAFGVAVIAMLGSLYFSEILQFIPCEICWYVRIIMYPIVLILGIAIVRKDYSAAIYSTALSAIGIPVSLYLYLLQKVPTIADSAPACGVIPCTTQYINWLGFITIPFLAFIACIIIFISSVYVLKCNKEDK